MCVHLFGGFISAVTLDFLFYFGDHQKHTMRVLEGDKYI